MNLNSLLIVWRSLKHGRYRFNNLITARTLTQIPLPTHWKYAEIPIKYRIFKFFALSTLFGGSALAHFFENKEENKAARDVLSAQIHYISCLTVFNTGLFSGIETGLSCSFILNKLDWATHIRQMSGLTNIFFASFASGMSYNSPRDSLYILAFSSGLSLANDFLFKQTHSPTWLLRYKKQFIAGLVINILILLMCESQSMMGRAIRIDNS